MRRVIVLGVALAVAGAACSSSKSTKTTTSTTAASGATSTTTTAGSGGGTAANGAPIKIAVMAIASGSFAVPDRDNAIKLAVDQINAKGGVAGHKIEWTEYDTGILPQTTVTAVTKAVSDHPTVMIGLAVSSGVAAAAQVIKQSGIPTFQFGSDNTNDFSRLGVPNLFRPSNTARIETDATAQWILDQHPKTVGLFDDSDTNGKAVEDSIQAQLQKAGVKVTRRESAQGATDVTEAALAMKGNDIVGSNGFQQTQALMVKTLFQNGNTSPIILDYGDDVLQAFNLVPQAALNNSVYQSNCDPDAVHSPEADAFVSDYKAKYGANVTQTASTTPQGYDAVNFIAQIIQAANGDISPSTIIKGVTSLDFTGVCGQYKTDAEHNMTHTAWIVSLKGSVATKTLVKTYTNMASS